MTKTFLTKSKAEAFKKQMEEQGFESVKIWIGKDGFGQTTYTVKWF